MAAGNPDLEPVLPRQHIRRSFWVVTRKRTRHLQRVHALRAWLAATVRDHRDLFRCSGLTDDPT